MASGATETKTDSTCVIPGSCSGMGSDMMSPSVSKGDSEGDSEELVEATSALTGDMEVLSSWLPSTRDWQDETGSNPLAAGETNGSEPNVESEGARFAGRRRWRPGGGGSKSAGADTISGMLTVFGEASEVVSGKAGNVGMLECSGSI